jgi:hypothetical protein
MMKNYAACVSQLDMNCSGECGVKRVKFEVFCDGIIRACAVRWNAYCPLTTRSFIRPPRSHLNSITIAPLNL